MGPDYRPTSMSRSDNGANCAAPISTAMPRPAPMLPIHLFRMCTGFSSSSGARTSLSILFVKPINPLSTPLLSQHLGSDAEALSIAAEFYFRRGHYSEALQLFNRIEELTPPSAELYQKKGYVLEMTGTPDDALEAYHTADLIDSDSVWTLRRIAALLVRTGRHSDALSFFDRIEAIKPDRRTDIMARARCLMELKRHTLMLWPNCINLIFSSPTGLTLCDSW